MISDGSWIRIRCRTRLMHGSIDSVIIFQLLLASTKMEACLPIRFIETHSIWLYEFNWVTMVLSRILCFLNCLNRKLLRHQLVMDVWMYHWWYRPILKMKCSKWSVKCYCFNLLTYYSHICLLTSEPRVCGWVVKTFRGSLKDPNLNLHHTRFPHVWPPKFSYSFSEK